MAIQLRADDVMPWGPWEGHTLRTVFSKDKQYYTYLLEHEKDYIIDKYTCMILNLKKQNEDKTEIVASKVSYYNRIEYKYNDVIDWGIHKGETLLAIFLKNETYFRFIVENNNYYVSEKTLNTMKMLRNNRRE